MTKYHRLKKVLENSKKILDQGLSQRANVQKVTFSRPFTSRLHQFQYLFAIILVFIYEVRWLREGTKNDFLVSLSPMVRGVVTIVLKNYSNDPI